MNIVTQVFVEFNNTTKQMPVYSLDYVNAATFQILVY
jgi:hypothetical protein